MSEWKVAFLIGAALLLGAGLLEAHDAYTEARIAEADCVQPKISIAEETGNE